MAYILRGKGRFFEQLADSVKKFGTVTHRSGKMGIFDEPLALPDGDLGRVRETVAGLPVEEAVRWMQDNLPLKEPPRAIVTPNWLGRVPWITFRIQVSVEIGEE